MDAVVKNFPKTTAPAPEKPRCRITSAPRPSRPFRAPRATRREAAVRTLLAYIGDNPDREGLVDTPKRFVNAYEELFGGYQECPAEVLDRTFSEIGGYDDLVLVRDIPFYSHCEHHVMPFTGKAHIAYVPTGRVVGLSKIARLIDVYARRLQTQEHLTSQIATAIEEILKPRGVAVMLEAEHTCMSMRGVAKPGSLDRHDAVHRPVPSDRAGAGALHHDGARRRADRSASRGTASDLTHSAERGSTAGGRGGRARSRRNSTPTGCVTCVATDAASGDVLMVAHMNAEALARTIESGEAWYFSRSRRALWRKGESSGHVQRVTEMRVDCDQDAVWIKVEQAGPGACHTGRRSCFYRAVPLGKAPDGSLVLEFRDAEKAFDPETVYGSRSADQ